MPGEIINRGVCLSNKDSMKKNLARLSYSEAGGHIACAGLASLNLAERPD